MHNARLADLEVLVGAWELTAVKGERVMSRSRTTFRWLGDDARTFLAQRTDPPSYLVPEWEGAAPQWAEVVYGLDDHSGAFTALYADARGVRRVMAMTFDAGEWTMAGRPGPEFHQRFHAVVAEDGGVIEGRWEASPDGRTWATDFVVTYRRTA